MVQIALSPRRPAAPPIASAAAPLIAGKLAPPRLVGEHFATALLALLFGAATLLFLAPELAAGHFHLPRVVAAAHLFTLGWVMLSIFGALCQFLPVAVDRPLKSYRLAHVSFAAHALGLAAFVTGLALPARPLLLLGAASLTLAFLLFAGNLTLTLRASPTRTLTWWALAGATLFIIITPTYGLILGLNLGSGFLTDRFALVAHHAHVALLGVVLLVMIGVAHRLLPMFLLTHGIDERPAKVALALVFSAALLLALPFSGPTAVLGGLLGASGVIAFLVQARLFYRGRTRRAVDPGMKLAASGLLGLFATLVLAPFALSAGMASPSLLAAYYATFLGSVSLFIAGHYYKIVPFLVWNHRYGPLLGKRKVPKVADLYSPRVANVSVAALVSGLATLVVGIGLAAALLITLGAALFLLGALIEATVLTRVALHPVSSP